MVWTVELKGAIEFADVQTVFKLLYGDDAFVRFYHNEANGDDSASATPWTEQPDHRFRREVSFKPRLNTTNLPYFLRQLIVVDLPRVTEVEHYSRDGNMFIIQSELTIALPTGANLTTMATTKLSPTIQIQGEGCELQTKLSITLEASLLSSRAENQIGKLAKSSFSRWLRIARVFCEEKTGMEKESLMFEDDEVFYDAEEVEEQIESQEATITSKNSNMQTCNSLPSSRQPTQGTSFKSTSVIKHLWRCLTIHTTTTCHFLMSISSFASPWVTVACTIGTCFCLGLFLARSSNPKCGYLKSIYLSILCHKSSIRQTRRLA